MMHSFKKHIELQEKVQWTRSLFDHLFTLPYSELGSKYKLKQSDKMQYLIPDDDFRYQLPLVPAMIERVVGSVVTYGIHASSAENLEKLIKLQGKKAKQISVYTTDEEGRMVSGVHGGGGVYSILQGNVYAGGSGDIMSIVDKQGRRLVDLGPESELAYMYDYGDLMNSKEYKKMWNDLRKFRNTLTSQLVSVGKKSIPVLQTYSEDGYIERSIDSSAVSGSIKNKFIKKYIDGTEKVLRKHNKVFANMYISWARKQSKKWNMVADSYDEMVMGNIKIIKVYVDEYYKDDFINWFAKIPDEDRFEDDFVEPTWDDVQKKIGFKFPVEFISEDKAFQLLPKFIKTLNA